MSKRLCWAVYQGFGPGKSEITSNLSKIQAESYAKEYSRVYGAYCSVEKVTED